MSNTVIITNYIMPKPAHSITPNTIIGFVSPCGNLYYVTMDYDVADWNGKIISTDVDKCTIGNPVYGRDIAAGIAMTIRTIDQVPNKSIGISINTMRVGNGNWSLCTNLL